MREPYKAERDRCSALIVYLTPLDASTVVGAGEAAATGSSAVSNLGEVYMSLYSQYLAHTVLGYGPLCLCPSMLKL